MPYNLTNVETGEVQQIARTAPPLFSLWNIGHGFEGTPADWTEYFFTMTGFISLIFWLWQHNPNPFDQEVLDRIEAATAAEAADAQAEGQGPDGEEGLDTASQSTSASNLPEDSGKDSGKDSTSEGGLGLTGESAGEGESKKDK